MSHQNTDNYSYSLTPEQLKAFKALERAFRKCEKVGIYCWDDYGTISAVNGNLVESVAPENNPEKYGFAPLDRDMTSCFFSPAWHGSNADDPLYVKL